MPAGLAFPQLEARNLEGVGVSLPEAFEGRRNVVLVAFRREHQSLVDSWVPWLEARAATDPAFRFYELPTIGRLWAPMRNIIDGCMAAAIREPVILRRTLTVYGDVRRLTEPLGIDDRSTVTVLALDDTGAVHWSGKGGFEAASAAGLGAALDSF